MRTTTIALVATALILGALVYNGVDNSASHIPRKIHQMFVMWKLKHHRNYGSVEEERYREKVFYHNYLYVDTINKAGMKWSAGINKFADLTKDEFLAKYTSGVWRRPAASMMAEKSAPEDIVGAPKHFDWRPKGAVTGIKNQGQCGSCWAFSTTGGLEGIHFLKFKKLVSYSEQQLVDCSMQNSGCDGGLPSLAFQYVESQGIETESEYPYYSGNTQSAGTCKYNAALAKFKISGYVAIPQYDNDALLRDVLKQPISIGVDADNWQFYTSGVLSGCGQQLDHGVLIVGYGQTSDGTLYWIVKNSWGTDWGMKGYLWIERVMGQQVSPCGVSEQATYPTVA